MGATAPCRAMAAGTDRLVQSARRLAPISLAIIEPHERSAESIDSRQHRAELQESATIRPVAAKREPDGRTPRSHPLMQQAVNVLGLQLTNEIPQWATQDLRGKEGLSVVRPRE
jgi:hypothetical protein